MKKIRHILVVEDDELNIFIYKYAIKKFKLTSNLAIRENGKQALTYLEEQSKKGLAHLPSLILLDIEMPIMNGVEFLEEYRKLPKQMQVSRIIVASTSNKVEQYNFKKTIMLKKLFQNLLVRRIGNIFEGFNRQRTNMGKPRR